jgi:hypothetical protein
MIAGICTMTLLVYGFDKLRYPEIDDSLFFSLKSYPPRLAGAMCVAVSLAIPVATVDRWAKMLSGSLRTQCLAAFWPLLAEDSIPGLHRSSLPDLGRRP